ncbi:hypothetical protein [Rufibacter roseus]|uniref:Outer membrane protein beta-barrel domain-containing protein n=1 Tax=Rufibacter roseus TaxID=1567108 RepID=A0ABW2DQL7_9BACT|nr:hypothetical protein [Rufibacter roseus]
MKKAALTFCTFLASVVFCWSQTFPASANEPETLFQGDVNHSFYIAPSLLLTHWQERSGLMVGGKAAWVMNHRFGIGLSGYGLVSRNNIGEIAETNNAFLQAGYGGAYFEYTPQPSRLLHLSFPVLIGMGGAAYTNNALGNNTSGSYSYEVYDTDTFFVLEPGVQAELNLARFMRLGLGVSYRFAQGVDLPKSTDKDMSAPAVSLIFKFGKF